MSTPHPFHPATVPDVPGAVFVLDETAIAFADSARTLDTLTQQLAEERITQDQYRAAVRAEIHAGRMLYTGAKSHEVELTGKTLGCLLEFRVNCESPIWRHRLLYAFAQNFKARRL